MSKILEIKNISKKFIKSIVLSSKFINFFGDFYREEIIHAVDNVSFDVMSGEVVCLVG